MGKRTNGEGSIWKRVLPDGKIRYEGAISYLDGDGRRKRKTVYGKTTAVVKEKLKEIRDRLDAGAPVSDSTLTVARWFEHWRTVSLQVSDRKPSTKSLYASLSVKHIEGGVLGERRLDQLKPTDIEKFLLTLTEQKLSESTIRQIYTVLRTGLDGAVRDELLARNPAALVKRPKVTKREVGHLDPKQAKALLVAAGGSRYALALELIFRTGLRRGEVLALRWADLKLDGDAPVLRVTQTLGRVDGELTFSPPKSLRSRREIPLTPGMVAALKAHREAQNAERVKAANLWVEHGLVFCTEVGRPVEPRNLLRVVEAAAKKADLQGVGVHTLRHSAATAMLEGGTHIKAVSDLLGHGSVAVTGDVYGHTSDSAARGAVELLDGLLDN